MSSDRGGRDEPAKRSGPRNISYVPVYQWPRIHAARRMEYVDYIKQLNGCLTALTFITDHFTVVGL